MLFDKLFDKKELEKKIKKLYYIYSNNSAAFEETFEDIFGLSYRLCFGKITPEEVLIQLLGSYYRNEFFVKAKFSKQYQKSQNLLFEYPTLKSRADMVDISNLVCFEIKTEYDDINRLKSQLDDYLKCFKYVYIICPSNKLKLIKNSVPKYCGIITYFQRKNCVFHINRKAKTSPSFKIDFLLKCINKKVIDKCFHTTDYSIIKHEYSDNEAASKINDQLVV